jgi:rare lipoprotein A
MNNPAVTRMMPPGWLQLPALLLLSACSVAPRMDGAPPAGSIDVSTIHDAVPRVEPHSEFGNPSSYVVNGRRYYVMNSSNGYVERGIASWYGNKFHGHRTSSGETYNMYAMTAAHKELPLPTFVKITNLRNGRSVVVRVNDRGPFHKNRLIDVSYAAAVKLGIIRTGTGLVEVRAIDPRTYQEKGRTIQVRNDSNGVNTDFYIQVGAFSSLFNAQNLQTKLAALTVGRVRISEAVVNGGTVFRVQIGPLSDVDAADHIVAALERVGLYEHSIVFD